MKPQKHFFDLCAWSLASGATISLAHGTRVEAFVAWFAFVPVILMVQGMAGPRATLLATLVGGIPWAAISTQWIAESGTGPLALKWAVTTAVASIPWFVFGLVGSYFVRVTQWPASLWVPIAWTLGEFFFSEFCFRALGSRSAIIGDSQIDVPFVNSLAGFSGVEGLSFLILSANGAVADLLTELHVGEPFPYKRLRSFGFVLLVGMAMSSATIYPSASSSTFHVGLWPHELVSAKDVPAGMMERRGKVDLWVLPEISVREPLPEPSNIDEGILVSDGPSQERLSMASQCDCPVLIGTCLRRENSGLVNAVLLAEPNGKVLSIAEKHQLVVFHEMFRIDELWSMLTRSKSLTTTFQSGKGSKTLRTTLASERVELGVVICSEVTIPRLVRTSVSENHDAKRLLVIVGNESQIRSEAGKQFLWRQARWRAIENQTPVVRCTSQGLTGVIDSNGRVRSHRREKANDGIVSGRVDEACLSIGSATMYRRFGSSITIFSFVLLGLSVVVQVAGRRSGIRPDMGKV